MSRTPKRGKSPGYDYWQRRPGNEGKCNSPAKHKATKIATHKAERRLARKECKPMTGPKIEEKGGLRHENNMTRKRNEKLTAGHASRDAEIASLRAKLEAAEK